MILEIGIEMDSNCFDKLSSILHDLAKMGHVVDAYLLFDITTKKNTDDFVTKQGNFPQLTFSDESDMIVDRIFYEQKIGYRKV